MDDADRHLKILFQLAREEVADRGEMPGHLGRSDLPFPDEILLRRRLGPGGSIDALLHLAELAWGRKAYVEARAYLKTALLRDLTRPEPYYWLGFLYESEGDVRQAAHYYYLALDASLTFRPARDALTRLGRIDSKTS